MQAYGGFFHDGECCQMYWEMDAEQAEDRHSGGSEE